MKLSVAVGRVKAPCNPKHSERLAETTSQPRTLIPTAALRLPAREGCSHQRGAISEMSNNSQSIESMLGRLSPIPTASGPWRQTAMSQRNIIYAVGAIIVIILIIFFARN
jgi:hypothetical protein